MPNDNNLLLHVLTILNSNDRQEIFEAYIFDSKQIDTLVKKIEKELKLEASTTK